MEGGNGVQQFSLTERVLSIVSLSAYVLFNVIAFVKIWAVIT
ncbi:hypothetical protein KIS4809_4375 [Bacillus sp. ZZV12-4809]|nr:hypothetical protein KIS4809_4375 [Bacillus sp. ZZV12-4809]